MVKTLGWIVLAGCAGWLWFAHAPTWLGKAWSSLLAQPPIIAERQELMKNNAAHFRDLRQKTTDGQLTRIAVNAQSIAMNARRIPSLFPQGSLGTAELPSRAKAIIWQQWEDFAATAQQAQNAAHALMELTTDAETKQVTPEQINEATRTLGETCKTCHKTFREPER